MGRRKRQLLDDSDSSAHSEVEELDDEDQDLRDERALFENPYHHKRRKQRKREFGDDSDEEDEHVGPSRRRSDWTKAPAFVSSQKVEPDQSMDVDVDSDADRAATKDEDSDEDEGGSQASVPKSTNTPGDEDEEMEDRPRMGLGSSKTTGFSGLGFTKAGIGSLGGTSKTSAFSGFSRGGIGSTFSKGLGTSEEAESGKEDQKSSFSPFRRGGIGSSSRDENTTASSEIHDSLPKAFGATRVQRSFVRDDTDSAGSSRSATPNLSAQERVHFNKLEGSYGARMLAKMGWVSGTGLGVSGEGRINPVEQKVRKKGMGIAFGGFSERTAQEKAEARRKGLPVSDDEEGATPGKGKGKAGAKKEPSDAWKRPRKIKTKVEHKTYEEILAETKDSVPPASSIGPIIDATGSTLREVSSLADVSIASWTPTSDATRIPEVRHNLRLVVESAKSDLEGLAREAKVLEARKKYLREEDARLRKRIKDEADLIARLQQVHLVVDDINSEAKQVSASYEPTLDTFSPSLDKLLGQFAGDVDRYRLDEIVVAAISPVLRRLLVTWNPLEDPSWLMPTFHLWRRALKVSQTAGGGGNQVQAHGGMETVATQPMVQMTPFESWLWHAWLPRVRSAINNDWVVEDPQPAIRLYEAWSNLLPGFVRDNFFDQLVIPKLHKAIADWSPRRSNAPLHSLIFPWLPYVGLRIGEVLGDSKRKLKSQMRGWTPTEGIPRDFLVWKDVHDPSEWDSLLLKYVVPKLGATLREDFQVNPAQQDLKSLQSVLSWAEIIRPSIFSQLLEAEFFPKWLKTLHQWLVHPEASFEEVAQWYSSWKRVFPEDVQRMSGVERGFTKGLELMNKAIELGPAVSRLPPPDVHAAGVPAGQTKAQTTAKTKSSRTQEITFRSIVDDYASSHNLMFFPAGKVDEKTGHALFRVSKSTDGKGGMLVYIADDAVWAMDGDQYRAIPLEEMILRATKG